MIPAPRFWKDACAASRLGFQGCRACAEVCPHEALHFGQDGPAIDAGACQRCGACTAACPTGALERAYLPDAELFARVAWATAQKPSVLILACAHDETESPPEGGVEVRRLHLPCVSLVSDDLLLDAIARGAGAVFVESDPRCPHWPHAGPSRAVATASAVLKFFGKDGMAVAIGRSPGPEFLERASALRNQQEIFDVVLPGNRAERRAALLAALAASFPTRVPVEEPGGVVPWRRVVVDQRACTLCGACAFVCPSAALALSGQGDVLLGRQASCIGCHLCEQACPENAMALFPVVPDGAQVCVLAQQQWARCHRCGRPVAPELLVTRLERMFVEDDAASRLTLRLCEDCKSERIPGMVSEVRRGQEAASPTVLDAKAGGEQVDRPLVGSNSAPLAACGAGTVSRRTWMEALAVAAATAVLSAGCSAAKSARKHRYGMVIDLNRCVGCNACMVACKAENHTPPGVSYMVVLREKDEQNLRDRPIFFARPCYHCERPSCVKVCPTGATYKRQQDGIVVIDYDKCIGCRYCITACPYGARSFDFGEHYEELPGGYSEVPSPEYREYRPRPRDRNLSPQGNVRKCTFCIHLQDEEGRYDKEAGRWPACVKTCTGKAIHFGDLDDPDDPIVLLLQERRHLQLKKELGNEPNVFYLV